MAEKNKFWKRAALGLGILGIAYGAFKTIQYFTERTRQNRVRIQFVR